MKTLAVSMFCLASVAFADDFKTINGKEYKDATFIRVEPDGIVLKTKSGISKVYFVELPKEVQERFHYNPANSTAATQPTPRSTISERENQELWVTIIQVLPQGVLAYGQVTHKAFFGGQAGGQPLSGGYYDVPSDEGKNIFLQGFSGSLAEGERFQVQAYADGTYTYQDASGTSRTLEKWVFIKLTKRLE
jgi:hypothetical protein